MSSDMSKQSCPVCNGNLTAGYRLWHYACARCSYEKSDLNPNINLKDAHEPIDEDARESGLRNLRLSNFEILLKHLHLAGKNSGRLLEVGCAHGWFLEVAKNSFDVLGIEPDQYIFDGVSKKGLPVLLGFFPDALEASDKFDVIVFNDVFEHIPDIQIVLENCYRLLAKDGLLLLNLPSSKGIIYRTSKLLCSLGLNTFFDRMWQKDIPSPHLHYFSHGNLNNLLHRHGFSILDKGKLKSLRLKGLYTRISHTGNYGPITSSLIWLCTAISLPLLWTLPSDIIYVIARKA